MGCSNQKELKESIIFLFPPTFPAGSVDVRVLHTSRGCAGHKEEVAVHWVPAQLRWVCPCSTAAAAAGKWRIQRAFYLLYNITAPLSLFVES